MSEAAKKAKVSPKIFHRTYADKRGKEQEYQKVAEATPNGGQAFAAITLLLQATPEIVNPLTGVTCTMVRLT